MTLPLQNEAGWGRWSLPIRFLLAEAVVVVLAMLSVGFRGAARIEQGVGQSSATTAADHVETFIAPLAGDLSGGPPLATPVRRALEEAFASPAVAERTVSYKIWLRGGVVLMASDAGIVGKTFEESADLKRAWTGEVAASCQDFGDAEDDREAALGIPLLEVQSPLDDYFTGHLIAVVGFYQNGTALAHELADARRKSWMVAGGAFLASGMLLFGIVQAGRRTIDRQRKMLETRLAGTRAMAVQNTELKRRFLQEALSNATRHAGTDRALARIARGEAHITPALAAQVLTLMRAPRKTEPAPTGTLTKREEGILRRVARGLSNREVAEELALQEKTVKHYMTEILGKLHARNRVEAAIIAHETWRDVRD